MVLKNCFEIPRAPSEIPANLPGQFSLCWQTFLHWIAVFLKECVEFDCQASYELSRILMPGFRRITFVHKCFNVRPVIHIFNDLY